jgi:hypothetical protein
MSHVFITYRLPLPKHSADSLFFRLKEGGEKYEARLDNPQRPDLCGPLTEGASFELFVTGSEPGVFVLAENNPTATGQ